MKSNALILGDSTIVEKADSFHTLCAHEWGDMVSSSALQTLQFNKMNRGNILPLTEDIELLQKYLKVTSESKTPSCKLNSQSPTGSFSIS